MEIFLDSADIKEIKEVISYGILDGVTTNPSLIKKASIKYKVKDFETYIKKMLKVCKGKPVSLEVIGTNYNDMVSEGKTLYKLFNGVAKNVVVKIPVNPCLEESCSNSSDGIKAIKALSKLKIPTNCTLVFTAQQALLAAKAGATYVSPFVGREDDYLREVNNIKFEKSDYYPEKGFKKHGKYLKDNGIVSGVDLIQEIAEIFKKGKIKTKILSASIRNKRQLREVELAGTNVATIPFSVIKKLLDHPKSSQGMIGFIKDVVPEYKRVFTKKKK